MRIGRAPIISRPWAHRAVSMTQPASSSTMHTSTARDDEHLQLLGLRMDSLKRRKISERELREAFSDAVVGGAGRCSDFSALQNAFDSLSATVRSMVPRSGGHLGHLVSAQEMSRVEVTRGTYAGKLGNVVRRTAARVVVRLADGGEVCLHRSSLQYIEAGEQKTAENRSAVDDGHCPSWAH